MKKYLVMLLCGAMLWAGEVEEEEVLQPSMDLQLQDMRWQSISRFKPLFLPKVEVTMGEKTEFPFKKEDFTKSQGQTCNWKDYHFPGNQLLHIEGQQDPNGDKALIGKWQFGNRKDTWQFYFGGEIGQDEKGHAKEGFSMGWSFSWR